MATQAYYQWVTAGRPWRLATPIAELVTWAKANAIPILGTIGNEDHLTDDWPQDHTPFSVTAWPGPLPGYVVTAIDLRNDRGLGQAILDKAKAGQYPWLKYVNFAGHYYDSRTGWQPEPNADYHVHLSIRTDWIDRSIGNFDPLGNDMTPDELKRTPLAGTPDNPSRTFDQWANDLWTGVHVRMTNEFKAVGDRLGALEARPPVQPAPVDIPALVEALRPLVREEVRAAFADGGRVT